MFGRKKWSFDWPKLRPPFKPFQWAMDSGGRDQLIKVINANGFKTMVEVGVFCGGGSRQWLTGCPGLTVYGVDPYPADSDVAGYFQRNSDLYRRQVGLGSMTEDEFVQQMSGHDSLYPAVLSNLWEFRDRFFPVRGAAPEALGTLARGGVTPDIVYLDAAKRGDELAEVARLWPKALISGNGWTWVDGEGKQPLHAAVNAFASRNNLEVKSFDGTWLLKLRTKALAGLA